jgi:hypothetical protein
MGLSILAYSVGESDVAILKDLPALVFNITALQNVSAGRVTAE